MSFFSNLYQKRLLEDINKGGPIPQHLILVLMEKDLAVAQDLKRLKSFIEWCIDLDISILTIYVSILEDKEYTKRYVVMLEKRIIEEFAELKVRGTIYSLKGAKTVIDNGETQINFSLGLSGKKELINAVKEIIQQVDQNKLNSETIDEKTIEQHLIFKAEPDLVIRSGGSQLTDFLIWQSVYSELYFTDVIWQEFREIDLLRGIRDYQKRQRRFGR